MRDWTRHDQYVNKLYDDIYPQPEDGGHTKFAQQVIDRWMSKMTTCHSVLDVGCGTGFCQDIFEKWGVQYEGVCLGEDYLEAIDQKRNVKRMDFSFLDYPDNSFDMIFSRHSLEHSPMPLLTLMEWRRVGINWLGLVLPTPDWYTVRGRNHYSVMYLDQIKHLLDTAGWNLLWEHTDNQVWDKDSGEIRPHEFQLMCEKKR
jgi:SAM-dependent methyltransferase